MLSTAPLGETFACFGQNWTAALVRETRHVILLAKAMARGGGGGDKAMMVIRRKNNHQELRAAESAFCTLAAVVPRQIFHHLTICASPTIFIIDLFTTTAHLSAGPRSLGSLHLFWPRVVHRLCTPVYAFNSNQPTHCPNSCNHSVQRHGSTSTRTQQNVGTVHRHRVFDE